MYKVDRFEFESKKLADLALKEKNGIRYIKENSELDNPTTALLVYNKLNKKGMFKTPVGFTFLLELQERLYSMSEISREDIADIEIFGWDMSGKVPSKKENVQKKETVQKKDDSASKELIDENRKYKKRFRISFFFVIVLVVAIISMFAITYYTGANIINYENEIIGKYEEWESDLSEREQQLRDKQNEFKKKVENYEKNDLDHEE